MDDHLLLLQGLILAGLGLGDIDDDAVLVGLLPASLKLLNLVLVDGLLDDVLSAVDPMRGETMISGLARRVYYVILRITHLSTQARRLLHGMTSMTFSSRSPGHSTR